MNRYKQYNIKESDRFEPAIYHKVRDELHPIFKAITDLPARNKELIVLCFLKNHSLKTEWLQDNPEVIKLFTEGRFQTTHIDHLYESGKNNSRFIQSFEDYIRQHIL
ncbi:MAG TPA: hypothetical protein VFV31_07935 [Chitinophagaceae bacterium]|nr:hypothetical protein [Chitinophagaceae bacterium]